MDQSPFGHVNTIATTKSENKHDVDSMVCTGDGLKRMNAAKRTNEELEMRLIIY